MDLIVYVQQELETTLDRPVGERSGLLAVFAEGVESGTVTADEARDILLVLVSAGSETTASLLATAVETLAREPELQHRLRNEPERIPGAIEDILRTDGPFQFHYRATPHDTLLGGTPIPAHSRVLLMWAAANRPSPDGSVDPPDPSEGRGPAPHFAFGKGLHFCIGAPVRASRPVSPSNGSSPGRPRSRSTPSVLQCADRASSSVDTRAFPIVVLPA